MIRCFFLCGFIVSFGIGGVSSRFMRKCIRKLYAVCVRKVIVLKVKNIDIQQLAIPEDHWTNHSRYIAHALGTINGIKNITTPPNKPKIPTIKRMNHDFDD